MSFLVLKIKTEIPQTMNKIQMTKIAWETHGVRYVENIIKVDDQSSWKDKAKDLSNIFIKELLEFKGVELVLLSKHFLSVKKTEDVSWNELKPMVISHLNHYFENNNDPILKENKNR